MNNVYMMFWWDTEDFITVESDDIILDIVKIFNDRGLCACFKIVGEKIRTLEKRGRLDVISALERHEIGFHSNWHSVHPVPSETADGKRWKEGIDALRRREEPGFMDVRRVFQRTPEVYGQPGAAFAPHYYRLLRDWGVPTYLGSSVYLGFEDRPSFFQGIFNPSGMRRIYANASKSLEPGMPDPALGRLVDCAEYLSSRGGGIIGSYAHPCEFCTTQFWDGVNFSNGVNPPVAEWKPAPLRSRESRMALLAALENFIDEALRLGIKVVTAAEARAMYLDSAIGMRLSDSEMQRIALQMKDGVSYFESRCWTMTAGEIVSAMLNCVCSAGMKGGMPQSIDFISVDGPDEKGIASPVQPGSISLETFLKSCFGLHEYIQRERRLPNDVMIGNSVVSPEDYASLLARAVLHLSAEGRLPMRLPLEAATFLPGRLVRGLEDGLGWIIHPNIFKGETLKNYTILQSWSFKPAILNSAGC